MYNKLFLPFFIIQFVISPLSAQYKTIDSLLALLREDKDDTGKVIHLNKLYSSYQSISSYDTALAYCAAALQLAKQLGYKEGIAMSYNGVGVVAYSQGNYDKALENYFASLTIRKEIGDQQGVAASYNNIGIIYKEQGDYDKALENYFASLKIKEELLAQTKRRDAYREIKKGIAATHNNIGIIYKEQGNQDKALEFFFASLKIREEVGDKKGIAASYNNIGTIAQNQGNYDKALENHFASLRIRKEIGDKQGIAYSYNNIGLIYADQAVSPLTALHPDSHREREELLEKALENYFASLKINEEIGDKQGIISSYNNIGIVYRKLKQPAQAMSYCSKALALAKEIGSKENMQESYQNLSEIYADRGDYKNAFENYQIYSRIKDSIFRIETIEQIAEMQTKYETEKKEKEIKTQSYKLSEQELLLARNRLLLLLLAAGLLLLLVLGWVIFYRYKIKKESQIKSEMLRHQGLRTNAIIETQEKERKRIAQDLHDGIGHKLTILKFNFERISENIRTILPEERIIFEQTENILDETHKEVRALSHSMMPKALQERELTGAVSDLVEQTLANSTLKYSLKNDLRGELPGPIQICLYRILQELLNNILKHAQATEVAIQIFKNQHTIIMMVEDNGAGIKNAHKASGIGLHNIAGRISALNGIFTMEPGPVKGTVATVRIPLPQP